MNNTKERVKQTFNTASEKFDNIGTPFFKHYGKVLAEIANIEPDDIVLDLACGKGAATFTIVEMLNEKGKIYAIDISDNMIEECKKLTTDLNNKKINFSVMDAEQLEFENESFDKVVCGFGLFFLQNIDKGLSEIRRVLKPGGKLIFSSWNNEYRLKWLFELMLKYIPDLNKNKPKNNGKISDTDFGYIEGINKILKISGFRKDKITMENLDCFYENEEEWIESRWHTAFRMFFEQLSEKNYKNFKKELINGLQQYKENSKIKITMSAFMTVASKNA